MSRTCIRIRCKTLRQTFLTPSCLIQRRVAELIQAEEITSATRAFAIIAAILSENPSQGPAPEILIAYVFRLYLHSLAKKAGLLGRYRALEHLSLPALCGQLRALTKQPGTQRKLQQIQEHLKRENLRAFLVKIAGSTGQSTQDKPPQTLRRAPAKNTRTRHSMLTLVNSV